MNRLGVMDYIAGLPLDYPVVTRTFIVHPSWVEALLRDPAGAGLCPGDRLYTMEQIDAHPVPVQWENHERAAPEDSGTQLQKEAPV